MLGLTYEAAVRADGNWPPLIAARSCRLCAQERPEELRQTPPLPILEGLLPVQSGVGKR